MPLATRMRLKAVPGRSRSQEDWRLRFIGRGFLGLRAAELAQVLFVLDVARVDCDSAFELRRRLTESSGFEVRPAERVVHFGFVRESSDRDSCELHGAVGIRSVRGVQARELVR